MNMVPVTWISVVIQILIMVNSFASYPVQLLVVLHKVEKKKFFKKHPKCKVLERIAFSVGLCLFAILIPNYLVISNIFGGVFIVLV